MQEIQFVEPSIGLVAYSQGHVELPEEFKKIVLNLKSKGKADLASKVSSLSSIGPTELVTYGARGCRSRSTSVQLYQNDLKKWLGELHTDVSSFSVLDLQAIREKLHEKNEHMLDETVGSGHLAALDQSGFYTFSLENVTREVTLFLCAPHYTSHMQQSLRIVEPTGVYISRSIRGTKFERRLKEIFRDDLAFYREMVGEGIPAEDSRYVLALKSTTNTQSTLNARELTYIRLLAQQGAPGVVRRVVEKMVEQAESVSPGLFEKRGPNTNILNYYPASQLFVAGNEGMERYVGQFPKEERASLIPGSYCGIDLPDLKESIRKKDTAELANLKHIHFTFLVPESISCFHQSTRQRTWDQSVEPLNHALTRKQYVVPPTIEGSKFSGEFKERVERKFNLRSSMLDEGLPPSEVNGIVAHAHVVYVLIHMNGWNAIYSLGIRRCDNAQWEINERSDEMAEIITRMNPELGYLSQPNCRRFGYCSERRPCKSKDAYLKLFR